MTHVDVAMLLFRVWLAVVMLKHGIHHARSLQGTANWFSSKGFQRADLQARASAVGELGIGAALLLGAATSFAAAGMIATMVVAFWSIHRFAGFFVFSRPDEGYEYVATLSVAALVLAIVGPGELSVDHVLGLADDLDGWVGGIVAGAGVLAAGAQLAMFWRAPEPQDDGGGS